MQPILTQAAQYPQRVAAVKAAITDEEANGLLGEFRDNGGFTFRDHPGDGPTNGFMVSLPNTERTSPADAHSADEIKNFHNDYRPVIDADPANHHGDWNADGLAYQDVSRNIKNPWEAAETGHNDDQLAIYDLNQDKSIDTPDAINQLFWKGDFDQPGYIFSTRREGDAS